MKTNYYINLLLALTLVLNACKKNGNNGGNPTPTVKKYLTRQVIVSYAGGIGLVSTTTDYTYDSNKRKATEKSGKFSFTYTYYDDGKLFSSTELVDQGDALKFYIEYTYTGSLLTHQAETVYKNNQDFADYTTDYVYKGNLLTETHSDQGVITLNTYDSHNDLVKSEFIEGADTTTTISTYDSNHRKLTDTIASANPGQSSAHAYTYDSHNNVIKLVTTTGATSTTVNTTYVYDSDGYLTSYSADNGGHGTYTYSTLN